MQAISIDYTNIPESLISIGKELVKNYGLRINGQLFQLAEIEMYFHSEAHPDNSTHKHERQLENGVWYFHRRGNSYIGGPRKGLDLTFGNKEKGEYFGVLIRAIKSVNEDKYIYGPSLTVDFILEQTKRSMTQLEAKTAAENSYLTLVKLDPSVDTPIYEAPRRGLNKDTALSYFDSPYRILSNLTRRHDEKESRIIPYLLTKYPEEQLKKDFNYKSLNVPKRKAESK